jgi:hypothetical protein
MYASLLALSLLPRVDADVEVGHYVGLGHLRGTIRLGLDVEVLRAPRWHLDIWTATQSFVRTNHRNESPVRISPQQVWYPVGIRLRFPLGDAGAQWGIFASHQSNHDIDSYDLPQARETVAYEIYGAELVLPWLHLHGGLYYDRGTRISGDPQTLPFDYYLAGVTAEGAWPLGSHLYTASTLNLVGHRDSGTDIPYLNLAGHLDVGSRWQGARGVARVFVRGQRVEAYQQLGDAPEYLLLLGVGLGSTLR